MDDKTAEQTEQAEFKELCKQFKEYAEDLKRKWDTQNPLHTVNVLEVMSRTELEQVQRHLQRWASYVEPLAEAWWKERGYGVKWPADNSKPVSYHKLQSSGQPSETTAHMVPKETKGDHYNIACPHCGKNNHHVSDGVVVTCGQITRFTKLCFNCKKTIYYAARHEIMVTARNYDLFAKSV